MARLTDVDVDDLRAALDRVEGKRPTMRLLAAIAAKRGVAQRELAEWFGVERKTIHNWLKRFEECSDGLALAASDRERPGRPPKLDRKRREALSTDVASPPVDTGFDAEAWSAELLREHVRSTYDVEYSIASCRRLLDDLDGG